MNSQDIIDILTIHKDRLSKAKTFEEYRDAHVAYIDMLIGQISANQKWVEATETFISKE